MSLEILERVKGFLIKLVKDEAFRSQLMSEKVEEVKKVMTDGGYNFSQDEFETAAIKILELKELGHFEELSEEELVGAVGGMRSYLGGRYSGRYKWPIDREPIIQPLYGVVYKPPEDEPKPDPVRNPQPMYGVIQIEPPEAIAMYGVIRP